MEDVLSLPNAPLAVAERLAVALLGADPRFRRLYDGRWAVIAEVQGSPLIEETAFAVLDVETTGMRSSGADRVTEVAVVVVQGDRRELVFDTLVNPEVPIPWRIAALTGITQEMVATAPTFSAIADELLAVLTGRVFVAHNARFDWRFVSAEIRRARGLALGGPQLCTVRLARRLLPHLESRSLGALTEFFSLHNPARHRAAGDAMATAHLLSRLLRMARELGARTVGEVTQLCQRKRTED
jgi:DNA polymerase-3 subunit epsilon